MIQKARQYDGLAQEHIYVANLRRIGICDHGSERR